MISLNCPGPLGLSVPMLSEREHFYGTGGTGGLGGAGRTGGTGGGMLGPVIPGIGSSPSPGNGQYSSF